MIFCFLYIHIVDILEIKLFETHSRSLDVFNIHFSFTMFNQDIFCFEISFDQDQLASEKPAG